LSRTLASQLLVQDTDPKPSTSFLLLPVLAAIAYGAMRTVTGHALATCPCVGHNQGEIRHHGE